MYLVQKYKSILQRHFETEFIHLWKLQPWREDDGQPKRRNQVFEEKSPPPLFFHPCSFIFFTGICHGTQLAIEIP